MTASAEVRRRVEDARSIQLGRNRCLNHRLNGKQSEAVCALDEEGSRLLDQAMARLGLSARAYHRILRLARTIADLGGSKAIASAHVAEAVQYRSLDRKPVV